MHGNVNVPFMFVRPRFLITTSFPFFTSIAPGTFAIRSRTIGRAPLDLRPRKNKYNKVPL